MKYFETYAPVPVLTRRHALMAIGVAMASTAAQGSPRALPQAPDGSTSKRGGANAARQTPAPFILSF